MPQFPWQKSLYRSSSRSGHANPLNPAEQQEQRPDLSAYSSRVSSIAASSAAPVSQRQRHYLDNRRSIAHFPQSANTGYSDISNYPPRPPAAVASAEFHHPPRSPAPVGITRSRTVIYRDASRGHDIDPIYEAAINSNSPPTQHWSPDFQLLPTRSEQLEQQQQQQEQEQQQDHHGHRHTHHRLQSIETSSMNSNTAGGKTSSDSGSATGLDRWSQRRLQRLNTEQGFREQRQGAGIGQGAVLSPTPSNEHVFTAQQANSSSQYSSNTASQHDSLNAQPQTLHQQNQPQLSYPTSRSASNAALGHQASNNNNTHSRSPNTYAAQAHDSSHQQPQQQQQQPAQYSPSDTQYQSQSAPRPSTQQTRSYQQSSSSSSAANAIAVEADSTSMPHSNGTSTAVKSSRSAGSSNRQSMHNDLASREASNATSQPTQGESRQRTQQQSLPTSEDMSEDDVNQLIKEHKDLRDKYLKVKRFYFEKEDQVKQLQNSLAHQRMSQSRTSLDDSEYTTRFNRLDGLIAQLAFSIRKSWRTLPSWLANSVNKDAITTGKQEMTAAGRAFIACWLVEEVFDKYFHPDLEPALSAQLKSIQRNIRRYANTVHTADEEDILTAKVVNWRLATLEGLQDALRSPQCPTYRAQMTDMLKEHLCGALAVHLQDPPPSDLEGGVHMIVELVVSIAIHLPLESRDVVIEYFMPSQNILHEQMKVESGIPQLVMSIADDTAERTSMKSATSEIDGDSSHEQPSKKRGMLSALTGSSGKGLRGNSSQKAGAGGSSSSLQRPESSGKDESPRVRMAAGIGVRIRGRAVLVRAPVFST